MQGEESRVRIVPGPADRFAATARRLVQPAGDGRLAPRTPVPASRPRQNRSSPGRPSTARSLPVPGRDCTPARPRAAAQPAGFMAGHRPTCGRNQAAEHAHHQAPQPAPFDATARARPGFRPPASPEPTQPGRRADERGEPLSCSPPSGHRIAARPAPHAVLGLPLPAQDHGETAEMPRLRPDPQRLLAPLCVTAGGAPCTARSSHAAGARALYLATGAHAGGTRGTAYRPVLAAKRATVPHCDSAATAPPACTAETG